MEKTESRPVGRPPKETDPEAIHRAELLEWAAVGKRVRKLIEKQLSFFEKQLANADAGGTTLPVDTMLAVMDGLGKLLTTASKVVESGLKALEKGTTPRDPDDPEEVMAELRGGKGG